MRILILLPVLVLIGRSSAPAATDEGLPPLFDPARHMRVSEVRAGMKGYGLSVFKGTRIDRFDVEVISVLRNFNPKYDVVLIQCSGANLEHTGSVAGMSGSPIFLVDDSGKERMIGGFAYGWPLMKDPVAGVQPIEYMLALPPSGPQHALNEGEPPHVEQQRPGPRHRWSLSDSVMLPGMDRPPPSYPLAGWNHFAPNPQLGVGTGEATRLQPLATPLMAAGLPPHLLEQFAPLFRAHGLVPLQAGGGGAAHDAEAQTRLEPGSVLAVPLLSGDVELTAVGTCTEVIDQRVFGFGHAFNNEGPIELPMGSGRISAIIANLATSFKLGSMLRMQGTLDVDQLVGVTGRLGDAPAMAPIELEVRYADGSFSRSYRFASALHPRFTPLIAAAAFNVAVAGARDLPQYHTLEYELKLEFANGRTIDVSNATVNASAGELFYEIGTPLIAAADNPFERVLLKRMSGTITVVPEARQAQILSVNVPRLKFRPGQTVKAYVTYRPFRAAEAILPVEFELPRDLPEGTYALVVCDWQRYFQDEQLVGPFRFTAENIDEVFAVLRDVAGIKHNALYVRLVRQSDGVAVGRTAMPRLPSSRRQVLINSGRSNTTPFVSSTTKMVPTDLVMQGSAEFAVTIDKEAKVEVGGPPGHKGDSKDTAPSKPDEPKAKAKTKGEKSDAPAASDTQTDGNREPS